MLIILGLYILLVWLLFSKLKLVRWGWISGTLAVLGGAFILAVFLAMFNHLTPSGSFTVISRVIEVTPNVSGQVTAIPVKPNEPVKAGTVLFRIDPTPFQFKVNQLEASLAHAKQQVKQLKASYEQASANVEGLTKQNDFNTQRLADIQKLTGEQALSVFREQDTQVQVRDRVCPVAGSKGGPGKRQAGDGIRDRRREYDRRADRGATRATPNGSSIRRRSLHRATGTPPSWHSRSATAHCQARSVMSFIVTDEITIVGMFAPNGFQTIKPGRTVKLVFDNDPGRIYQASIVTIPEGIGQGQVAVSGVLAAAGSIGGAKAYPAIISIPTRHRSGQAPPRHAGNCDGVRRQRRRHWDADVDPGVDQLLHRRTCEVRE